MSTGTGPDSLSCSAAADIRGHAIVAAPGLGGAEIGAARNTCRHIPVLAYEE